MATFFGRSTVEEPPYEVLLSRDGATPYEVRKYAQRFIAETEEVESRQSAFRTLANYIGVFRTPENSSQTKISMTAPVVVRKDPKKKMMKFTLPNMYDSLDKIPQPTNQTVQVKALPPAIGAVFRYNGSQDVDFAAEKAKILAKQLRDDGLAITEEDAIARFEYWGYNPPFTIPYFRRNEVWIELTEEQAESLSAKR